MQIETVITKENKSYIVSRIIYAIVAFISFVCLLLFVVRAEDFSVIDLINNKNAGGEGIGFGIILCAIILCYSFLSRIALVCSKKLNNSKAKKVINIIYYLLNIVSLGFWLIAFLVFIFFIGTFAVIIPVLMVTALVLEIIADAVSSTKKKKANN